MGSPDVQFLLLAVFLLALSLWRTYRPQRWPILWCTSDHHGSPKITIVPRLVDDAGEVIDYIVPQGVIVEPGVVIDIGKDRPRRPPPSYPLDSLADDLTALPTAIGSTYRHARGCPALDSFAPCTCSVPVHIDPPRFWDRSLNRGEVADVDA